MTEETTLDEYRTGYIAEKHNVTDNCARALQLFELGFSISGASKRLPVSSSTVRKYHKQLQEKIHPKVVFDIHGKRQLPNKFDVWGDRSAHEYDSLSYEDGVADARASERPATDRAEQIDPEFREPERDRNRGMSIEEIPEDLITIRTE